MSIDIVDAAQLDSDLSDIADAIRAKTGGSAALAFPADFVSEIESISGGGGYTADEIASRSISGNFETSQSIGAYALYQNAGITALSISGNTKRTISERACNGCTGLTKVSGPVGVVGQYAFAGCTSLSSFDGAELYELSNYAFQNCSSLVEFVIRGNSGSSSNGYGFANRSYVFSGCTHLTTIDVKYQYAKGLVASFPANGFNGASALEALILRANTVNTLAAVSCFNGTPFASSGSGGTLYVPEDLVFLYQNATNWSTILGYANNSIMTIEGSIYETQYADGTPIT